ncbi:MAG: uridine kinase [Chitinophagales bacterium]
MLVVGIAGGTGAGKTTVVRKIMARLPEANVSVIPQDNYYKDNSHMPMSERQKLNFDHPSAIEFSLLVKHVKSLKQGALVKVPIYSYLTCTRSEETIPMQPKNVVIVEGILILSDPRLRDFLDIKVYVDAAADERLIRVIHRDILERGRNVREVLERYEKSVKPMHQQFIEPAKRYADIIVPRGGENEVAIDVLTRMISTRIQ